MTTGKLLPEWIGAILKHPSLRPVMCGTLSASLLDHSLLFRPS